MLNQNVFYCGYSVTENGYENVSQICGVYGKRALLIGGEKGLAAGRSKLLQALEGSGIEIVDTVLFGKECTYDTIHKLDEIAKSLSLELKQKAVALLYDTGKYVLETYNCFEE